jgi:hypothetical protein
MLSCEFVLRYCKPIAQHNALQKALTQSAERVRGMADAFGLKVPGVKPQVVVDLRGA